MISTCLNRRPCTTQGFQERILQAQTYPKPVVRDWTGVASIEFLVVTLLFQNSPFGKVTCQHCRTVFTNTKPRIDVTREVQRLAFMGFDSCISNAEGLDG